MQFEIENKLHQKVSALDPSVLNQLRFEKRRAVPHIKVISSMTAKSNLSRISSRRRNALINPLEIHFYIMNEASDSNESVLL